ncbi:MAG: MFS transporter [Turicibacter sp.]|nr:MFS transporter [Turicibacter sp.]
MKKFNLSFKLALISQIISMFGGNILRFSLLLFILDLTMSAEALGLATAISGIPIVIFAIPGGIIADRMNKKRCIVALDAAKTIISAGLLSIFLSNTYSLPILITFITLFAILVTLFSPIMTSAIPRIVSDELLVEANGLIQSINAVSQLLGFVLGGFLYATLGVTNIILLCGVFFLISTIIDLFIQIPYTKLEETTGILKSVGDDVKKSFHYMTKENPFLLRIALTYAILAGLFVPIFVVGLPYIVRVQLGASETMFGFAQGFTALGMLVGGLLAGRIKKLLVVQNFFKWVLLLSALCLILALAVYGPLFSGSTIVPFWLFNIGLLLIMVIVAFGDIIVMSNVQGKAPEHLLGKVIALVIVIANFSVPIGQYLFGLIMEALASYSLLFIAISLITFLVGLLSKKMFANID